MRSLRVALFLSVLHLSTAVAQTPSTPEASARGEIVEADGKTPVPGAQVAIGDRTAFAAADGSFEIDSVPSGAGRIVVSGSGYLTRETAIDLKPGVNPISPIALDRDVVHMDKFVVAEQDSRANTAFAGKESDERVQEQVYGSTLTQPSIQNASDALKNVSGVSVTQSADGSSQVSIRGLGPQMNRVSVDGQRQSASNRFSSAGSLESLPPEILKSIEVSKSLTPDMDADAIGGQINLSTANASDLKKPFAQAREQMVYSLYATRPGTRSNLSVGRPFRFGPADKPNAGVLATFTYDELYHPRENVETFDDWPEIVSPGPAAYAGAAVPALTHVNLEKTLDRRQRATLLFNVDGRLGGTLLFFKSNFGRDARFRTRTQGDFDVATGTPITLTPTAGTFTGVHFEPHGVAQNVNRMMATISMGAKTDLERLHLSTDLGFTRTEDREPHSVDAVFSSHDPYTISYDTSGDAFFPKLTFVDQIHPQGPVGVLTDPALYDFNRLVLTSARNLETNGAVQEDIRIDLDDGPKSSYLKFGGKFQRFHRSVTQGHQVYRSNPLAASVSETGLVGVPITSFRNGAYQSGPAADPYAVADLVAAKPDLFQLDPISTALGTAAGTYSANETIEAGYAMAKAVLGQWTVITGVRLEGTRFDVQANQALFSGDGSFAGFTPANAGHSYLDILPGLHLRFDPQPGLIFRASVYRSLIRPSYGDLAPYIDIDFGQLKARVGNPNLKPYQATNYDFSTDCYRSSIGLISAGLFFKSIKNFQVDSERSIVLGSLGHFVESEKVNGDTATIGGVEASWKSNPYSLPGSLGQVSLGLNDTLTKSVSHLPNRPGENLPMPSQARNQVSLALHDDSGGFSADINVTYHTKTLEEVISYNRDIYAKGTLNVDLGATYKLTKQVTLLAGVSNLTSAGSFFYSGQPSRLKEFETGSCDISAGINWKL